MSYWSRYKFSISCIDPSPQAITADPGPLFWPTQNYADRGSASWPTLNHLINNIIHVFDNSAILLDFNKLFCQIYHESTDMCG